ncbi:uncharacterized protein LOC109613340 [Musca domestica]|uniref:Uncharacterized protein LOC109613340 n=1 Tax=Musca domestica TaxID=7370 RepID=A0ABM3UN53_MUSDO|nr:uncharacterized protein LOC109613340 [Musca domestica]
MRARWLFRRRLSKRRNFILLGLRTKRYPFHRMLSETSSGKWVPEPTGKRGDGSAVRKGAPQLDTTRHMARNRLVATVGIAGRKIAATVDTGATTSFVIPCSSLVTLADGSQRNVQHAVETAIELGCQLVHARLLIMPDATEYLIIGLDLLAKIGARQTMAGLSCVFTTTREASESKQHLNTSITCNCGMPDQRCQRTLDGQNVLEASVSAKPPTIEEQKRIQSFLDQELQKFRDIHGPSTAATHRIVMTDDRSFKLRYAARNPTMQEVIDAKINPGTYAYSEADEKMVRSSVWKIKRCLSKNYKSHMLGTIIWLFFGFGNNRKNINFGENLFLFT